MNIPDNAIAGLLQWAYDFSEPLEPEKQVEVRMRVLQFVSLGFTPFDPGFDLEQAARGEQPAGAPPKISPALIIEAFRFYSDRRDQRAVTAAQILWHLIGVQRVASLN